MAATEYAAPFAAQTIATSQDFRERNRRSSPNGVDADLGSSALQVADGGGTTVTIQNGNAVQEGALYRLTGGPLSLAVGANGAGANRADYVVLTYDAAHTPGVYARIIAGTAGAGLPALTNSATGVWDEPLASYEKTPGGSIVNFRDRRRFLDNSGGLIMADDTNGRWFPPAPRLGQRTTFWPSRDEWIWDGSVWQVSASSRFKKKTVDQTVATTSNTGDSDLVINDLIPNITYVITCYFILVGDTATDIKFGFNFPSGASIHWVPDALNTGATGDFDMVRRPDSTGSTRSVGAMAPASGGPVVATPSGLLTMGSSTGSFQTIFSQVSGSGTQTGLGAGSWLSVRLAA